MAYKEVSAEENSIVNDHCSHSPLKFSVNVKDHQDKLPTMYWLSKLHKNIIKLDLLPTLARVLLLNFLNSCLTAVKTHAIRGGGGGRWCDGAG